MPPPPDRDPPTDDLTAILADLWGRLGDAAGRAAPAFHLPTLATCAAGGPRARVVVLRHADGAAGTLGCHADARSPKVAELAADPRAAWLFYDRDAKLQVRATGKTEILAGGPEFEAAWAATDPSARRCYLAPHPPGVPTPDPEPNIPPQFARRDPTDAESAPGRANFRLLRTTADELDWLALHHAGHRRARFVRGPSGWRGEWIAV